MSASSTTNDTQNEGDAVVVGKRLRDIFDTNHSRFYPCFAILWKHIVKFCNQYGIEDRTCVDFKVFEWNKVLLYEFDPEFIKRKEMYGDYMRIVREFHLIYYICDAVETKIKITRIMQITLDHCFPDVDGGEIKGSDVTITLIKDVAEMTSGDFNIKEEACHTTYGKTVKFFVDQDGDDTFVGVLHEYFDLNISNTEDYCSLPVNWKDE